MSYAEFAQIWAQRGYGFMVLYPASRQAALNAAVAAAGWNRTAAYTQDLARLRSYQEDALPAGAPASASSAYRYLGLAWDKAQLGRSSAGRAYLQQATRAGANPVEVRWISAELG
jgi:hypothetical protein